jgi:hypothetical protein
MAYLLSLTMPSALIVCIHHYNLQGPRHRYLVSTGEYKWHDASEPFIVCCHTTVPNGESWVTLSVQLSLDLASPLSYLAVYSPSILRASLDLTAT